VRVSQVVDFFAAGKQRTGTILEWSSLPPESATYQFQVALASEGYILVQTEEGHVYAVTDKVGTTPEIIVTNKIY
jgi:hypothetical protein